MKFFFIGLLLVWSTAYSQVGVTNVLSKVTDISTFSNMQTNMLLISDTIRGGYFNRYNGSDAVDNGMVFSDANGRKWKRYTTDCFVNVQWYGARATNEDNRAYLIGALKFIYKHPSFNTLYIPSDNQTAAFYKISDSILIDHPVKILGDGTI